MEKITLAKLHKELTKRALYANEKYVPMELSEACARSVAVYHNYGQANQKRETLMQRVEKTIDALRHIKPAPPAPEPVETV